MRLGLSFVLVTTIACGGSQKPAGAGGPGSASAGGGGASAADGAAGGGGASGAAGSDGPATSGGGNAGGASGAAGVAGDQPLTREDCAKVLGHIIDVAFAEKRKTMPPDQAPIDADAAKVRKQAIDTGTDECLQMPRPMFDCAMKAQDSAALKACDQ